MRYALPALAALACALTACQPQPLSQADMDAIKANDQAIVSALNGGNASAAASGYTENGVVQPSGMAPAVGTAQITKAFSDFLGPMRVNITLSQINVAGEGDIGWVTGHYHAVYTMKDTTQASPPPEDGKYLQVWKRQADKSWKAMAEALSPNTMPAMPAAPARPARRH
jgi:ketosteroid isomerase-like protein